MGTGHPFFAYPLVVREEIYPSNAIERVIMQLRNRLKQRGHFPKNEPGGGWPLHKQSGRF